MKNLSALHQSADDLSVRKLFEGEKGTATTIQFQKNGTLKEHVTQTPALLLCIDGRVTYKDENQQEFTLETGDFVHIVPNVKHWLYASLTSQLILLK
jgi:quercetin dioxygenase-like cupin family protein